jgi:hypothetical protein
MLSNSGLPDLSQSEDLWEVEAITEGDEAELPFL